MRLIMRRASVQWTGGSRGGTRFTSTGSGVLKQAHCASGTGAGEDSATNPAELIAAAHAGSFSLALSNELGLAGFASGNIATTATVTLEHLETRWTIMNIHLNVIATLPKLTQSQFIDATVRAQTSCFVSRVLCATVSISAKLEAG